MPTQYPEFSLGFGPDPLQPVVARNMPKPNARNAFGRVPFPEYWGVDGDKFIGVTAEQEALVEPMALAGLLGKRDSQFAINGIVLNPDEYAAIPINVGTFAGRVAARTVGARMHLETATEVEVPADQRAVVSAFRKSLPVLNNLESMYTTEIENLRWLVSQIPYHWHAHGKEIDVRARVVTARRSFENLVETVAASEGWKKYQLREALTAQEKRLLYGTLEAKKAEWMALGKIAGNYALGKRGLVRNKRDQMLRIIAVDGKVK